MLRRLTAIVLGLALLPQLTGCVSTKTRGIALPSEEPLPRERITSITTLQGEVLYFDSPGARLQRDTLFGSVEFEPVQIPLADVERLWVTKTETNTLATIGLVVGVAAGTLLVAGMIYAATKESCPFVYSWDGTRYVFDAEPYGGAVTRGLERDDYSELESLVVDDKGLYRLKITNEVRETQYTNLMELWVVDHPSGTRVVADEWGALYTVRAPSAPVAASDAHGRDLLIWLAETDQRIWEAPATLDESGAVRQDIVLTFPKPSGAATAKLVANVATGLWGSHMIRELLELRGNTLDTWYAQIDGNPAARESLFNWILREETYRLKIQVEEPTGWEVRGTLHGGGPFIAEDRVVRLDLSRVPGDWVRIRIRPPLGFWALNSFALDYSPEEALHVATVAPVEARDGGDDDVLSSLLAADDAYYGMPQTGDFGYVAFPAPDPRLGLERTVILHSRGYYRQHLSKAGEPNLALLGEIAEVPGAAVRLAAIRYTEWREARASQR